MFMFSHPYISFQRRMETFVWYRISKNIGVMDRIIFTLFRHLPSLFPPFSSFDKEV